MKVFVTGGNGFIGSVVVKLLIESGHEVVCLLRQSSKTHRLDGLDYERREGDVRDAASVRAGVEGCDAVIHLASLSSWDVLDSPEAHSVNIDGTRNVLDAAREAGGIRVVYVSSLLAIADATPDAEVDEETAFNLEGAPELVYSQLKHRAEVMCLTEVSRGGDVVIVNPAEVYGPNDTDFITAGNLVDFATSTPVLVCNGGANIAHVDDVAAGIVGALVRGRSGERYILGGTNVSIRELAALTLEITGRRMRIVTVPNRVLRALTRIATRLKIPLPYNPKVVPYATRYWYARNQKAQRELGVSFRSARDTLAPTVEWLKEAGHLS